MRLSRLRRLPPRLRWLRLREYRAGLRWLGWLRWLRWLRWRLLVLDQRSANLVPLSLWVLGQNALSELAN
jgi:hypothetical protein